MDESLSVNPTEQFADVDTNPNDEASRDGLEPEMAGDDTPACSEPDVADGGPAEYLEPNLVEQASAEYLGRWNRLVSTTNWEKGRIIHQWRTRLMAAGAPAHTYSDEAWSRRVGHVSSQHVGRLRRVYERFGEVFQQYEGLYWSHFLAALDWDDAEMWLEGAVQNSWSVSQMRARRWETLGALPEQKPDDGEIVAAEPDEDVEPIVEDPTVASAGSIGVVTDPEEEEAEEDEAETAESQDEAPFDASAPPDAEDSAAPSQPVRPFENLPKLPDDLQEAFETFKLAILAHKLTGWQEISCDAVLATLDALKQLALAPSDE